MMIYAYPLWYDYPTVHVYMCRHGWCTNTQARVEKAECHAEEEVRLAPPRFQVIKDDVIYSSYCHECLGAVIPKNTKVWLYDHHFARHGWALVPNSWNQSHTTFLFGWHAMQVQLWTSQTRLHLRQRLLEMGLLAKLPQWKGLGKFQQRMQRHFARTTKKVLRVHNTCHKSTVHVNNSQARRMRRNTLSQQQARQRPNASQHRRPKLLQQKVKYARQLLRDPKLSRRLVLVPKVMIQGSRERHWQKTRRIHRPMQHAKTKWTRNLHRAKQTTSPWERKRHDENRRRTRLTSRQQKTRLSGQTVILEVQLRDQERLASKRFHKKKSLAPMQPVTLQHP